MASPPAHSLTDLQLELKDFPGNARTGEGIGHPPSREVRLWRFQLLPGAVHQICHSRAYSRIWPELPPPRLEGEIRTQKTTFQAHLPGVVHSGSSKSPSPERNWQSRRLCQP